MIYAKAHDPTVVDGYFSDIRKVEERLEIVPREDTSTKRGRSIEVVKVQDSSKLLLWIERLALPELCNEERLDVVECLRSTLGL
jgi:hypothetical protein